MSIYIYYYVKKYLAANAAWVPEYALCFHDKYMLLTCWYYWSV